VLDLLWRTFWERTWDLGRHHVRQALGFEPDRSSLFRALEDLVNTGSLAVEETGSGRTPTRYRKTGAAVSPIGA
jgi:hypothetical protein